MAARIPSFWARILRWVDDLLPMPPQERARRDADVRDHSAYRRRRLGLRMLEKRGKGGFR